MGNLREEVYYQVSNKNWPKIKRQIKNSVSVQIWDYISNPVYHQIIWKQVWDQLKETI